MKKWKKSFLAVMAVLGLAIVAIGIWQRDNISAVIKTITSSTDEIAQEMNDTKRKLENDLKNQNINVISDFTAEEEKQIIKGELSVEDALSSLNTRYENSKNNLSESVNTQVNKLIGEKTVELYSLKAYYLGQLGQMEATVKAEYLALPKEKQNLIGKKDLVNRHMSTVVGLMNQCDTRVEEILTQLKSGLEKLKADTSIIKTIRAAYESEKNLKKAYYLSLLDE